MKKNDNKKGCNNGYVSFTPDDLKANASQDQPNAEAYEWLNRAMTTSSNVKKQDRKGGSISIDDIYPVTAEETEQMREYLDRAEQCAGNPNDPIFRERLGELRDIVAWSSQRHSRWQWILVAGVLLSLAGLWWMSSDAKEDVAHSQGELAKVEAWTEQDTTFVKESITEIDYMKRLDRANLYKQYTLHRIAINEDSYLRSAENNIQRADTASDKSRKKDYLRYAENDKKSAAKYTKEFAEINAMKYKDVHKLAIKEMKRHLKNSKGSSLTITLWTIFFIILIPVYIFAERPYGYTITRTRLESKIMGGIQKFFVRMAAIFFGTGLAMSFLPDTEVHWSDGTRTTEGNQNNVIIAIMKVGLMAVGAFIFCSISCFMMIYLTVQALRRNFDWGAIKSQATSRLGAQK